MRYLLLILIAVAFTGCGNETRASWEQAFPWTNGVEVPAVEPETVRVVYPDNKPVQDFESGKVEYQHGAHINTYDLEGNLVAHRWQASVPLK